MSIQNYWFLFQKGQLIITHEKKLISDSTFSQMRTSLIREYSLGLLNGIHCYTAELTPDSELQEGFEAIPLRKAFDLFSQQWYNTLAKAFSILHWDTMHQFCGRCAIPTNRISDVFERQCPNCKTVFYPRISPSVIVLIHRDDEILMARSPHFMPGAYGLIAGFVETGESLEDAIHREVKEEVNIEVKNIRYFSSQPWPFPDSLMIGFIAEYASGELIIDNKEIEAAGWYHYDQLPGRPSTKNSIGSRLLDYFIAQQSNKH